MSQEYDEFEFEYTKLTKTTKVINQHRLSDADQNKPKADAKPGIRTLYGKNLKAYDNIPFEDLLDQLTEAELEELTNEVDPDDTHVPASMRCKDQTKKQPTGPLNRRKLLEFLKKFALEQEDWPEQKTHEPGVKRGKVWVPKELPRLTKEDLIQLDLDDEAENVLDEASEADLIDLAGILGLHSMLNQDQYENSILNKGQGANAKFESIVKATQPKRFPNQPPNDTNVAKTAEQVYNNDSNLTDLNWNNIKAISKEQLNKLFEGLNKNTNLKTLTLTNIGLTDSGCEVLLESIKNNRTLTTLNIESNFISGNMIKSLIEAINLNQTIIEFRASNQRPSILGNRIEMEISKLVQQNNTLLRLGLNLDVPDARLKIAEQLKKNKDAIRIQRIEKQKSIEK